MIFNTSDIALFSGTAIGIIAGMSIVKKYPSLSGKHMDAVVIISFGIIGTYAGYEAAKYFDAPKPKTP